MTGALQVTVFDFLAQDCAHTAKMLREYFKYRRLKAQVIEFTQIQPFVNDFKDKCNEGIPYDIAFIGVDNMMGVEAARQIRGRDDLLPMFLVSMVSDFGLEGFRLRALDYLTKPVSNVAVEEAVTRITMKCYGGFRVPDQLLKSEVD